MIDNSCILASLIAVGYVVLKAYVLNRKLPWFGRKIVPPGVAPRRR